VERRSVSRIVSAIFCLATWATPAAAQSVAEKLSALLTDQTPPPAGYVRDMAAAQATFQTVAGLFQVELTNVPIVSPSGGFVYRFNPSLGTAERLSDSFGPFYTDRAVRNGGGQLSLGLGYQSASFTTLQGADLGTGTFPTNTARFTGTLQPFSVDTLSLDLYMRTTTILATYGVTDRLDIGTAVPFTTLQFSGRRVNTFRGQSALQSIQSGSASGLGDIATTVRYRLTGQNASGVAVGGDLRFPTGRQEDLLGTGKTALRLMGIGSLEKGRAAAHVNGGFGVGGVSRELFWSSAATWAAMPKLTVIGEFIGRRLSALNEVSAVYEPHPVLAGIDTMRWLPSGGGVVTAFLVTGAKFNVGGNWTVNGNLLTRLTDTGLRARVTPSVSVNRAVELPRLTSK
jgi:hypothetical protein